MATTYSKVQASQDWTDIGNDRCDEGDGLLADQQDNEYNLGSPPVQRRKVGANGQLWDPVIVQ